MIKKLFCCPASIFSMVSIIGLLSCDEVNNNSDTQSPVIQISSPIINSTLSEPTLIQLDATDNDGIAMIEILIDGHRIGRLINSPWEYLWQVSFYADGEQHNVEAKAIDHSGNIGQSYIIKVFVPFVAQSAPKILSPDDQKFITNSNQVELIWSTFPGAVEYNIMVFSDINNSNVEYFLTTSDTVITINQTAEGRQFWKVQPKNSGIKYGAWSDIKSFYYGNTVNDIDGNTYLTTVINGQEWMAEDLRVSRYQNGDPITNAIANEEWNGIEIGAYSWYNNINDSTKGYGSLYNWVAMVDSRNIAPEGWHVPSDEEWQNMVDYLSGKSVAGGKIKEVGTEHWVHFNIGATNESGFTAIPGGYRKNDGTFRNRGSYGYYGTTTESTEQSSWYWKVQYDGRDLYRYNLDKQSGFSVRCLKD